MYDVLRAWTVQCAANINGWETVGMGCGGVATRVATTAAVIRVTNAIEIVKR